MGGRSSNLEGQAVVVTTELLGDGSWVTKFEGHSSVSPQGSPQAFPTHQSLPHLPRFLSEGLYWSRHRQLFSGTDTHTAGLAVDQVQLSVYSQFFLKRRKGEACNRFVGMKPRLILGWSNSTEAIRCLSCTGPTWVQFPALPGAIPGHRTNSKP